MDLEGWQQGYKGFVCLNRMTGQVIWQKEYGTGGVDLQPVIFGETLYITTGMGVLAIDIRNGNQKWYTPLESAPTKKKLVITPNIIVVTSFDKYYSKYYTTFLDPQTGVIKESRLSKSAYDSEWQFSKNGIVGFFDGEWFCIDDKSLEIKWKQTSKSKQIRDSLPTNKLFQGIGGRQIMYEDYIVEFVRYADFYNFFGPSIINNFIVYDGKSGKILKEMKLPEPTGEFDLGPSIYFVLNADDKTYYPNESTNKH